MANIAKTLKKNSFSRFLLYRPCCLAAKLLQKSLKNQSKIIAKFNHFLDAIFDRFFIDFGGQDTSKIHPKSMINPFQHPWKKWSIFELIFYGVLVDLRAQDPSQDPHILEPQTPILEPRSGQDPPKLAPRYAQNLNLEPGWPQDPPKTPQDHSQDRFFLIFNGFLVDFLVFFLSQKNFEKIDKPLKKLLKKLLNF